MSSTSYRPTQLAVHKAFESHPAGEGLPLLRERVTSILRLFKILTVVNSYFNQYELLRPGVVAE